MPTEPEGEGTRQDLEQSWLDGAEKEFRKHYLSPRLNLGSVIGFIVAAVAVLWVLKELGILSLSSPLLKAKPQTSQAPFSRPFHETIGVYKGQAYLFNRSTEKVYKHKYDAQAGHSLEKAFDLAPYETFAWSPNGKKIVFVSRDNNELGDLYVVDMEDSSPEQKLITKREAVVSFPSDVVIKGDLPLAWDESADRIAIVTRKQTEERDALLVVLADATGHFRGPEKEKITGLAWSGDKIVFVAFENGEEKRFVVNYDGGALKEIK